MGRHTGHSNVPGVTRVAPFTVNNAPPPVELDGRQRTSHVACTSYVWLPQSPHLHSRRTRPSHGPRSFSCPPEDDSLTVSQMMLAQ